MTNNYPTIKIVNVSTGEEIERLMTLDEYEIALANQVKQEEEIAAKEAARQALLDRLGITANEAKLLLS